MPVPVLMAGTGGELELELELEQEWERVRGLNEKNSRPGIGIYCGCVSAGVGPVDLLIVLLCYL